MNLRNQNGQIIGFREEITTLANNVKDLENELSESKHKIYKLEYDFSELEREKNFQQKTVF